MWSLTYIGHFLKESFIFLHNLPLNIVIFLVLCNEIEKNAEVTQGIENDITHFDSSGNFNKYLLQH